MNPNELPRVYFLSLGCFKNTVDSENMIADLQGEGFVLTEDPARAGVIIVNTCGFIDPAKEESIDAILEASLLKDHGREVTLVAVGCLVERYRKELAALLPEVDIFLDLESESGIGRVLKEKLGLDSQIKNDKDTGRHHAVLTPSHLSFLKIAEGCSRHCTFCTIPSIRGPYRSRSVASLLEEAGRLESSGVKELSIISQDTVSYRDPSGSDLTLLLRELLTGTNIPWIRLLYLNPAGFDHKLVELIACEERLLGYVDIPIQHISDPVLKRMGRESKKRDIEQLVTALRERVAGVTLRTTVMVGFPGEGENDFRELLDFIERTRFDRLGVFPYSREEGTPASLIEDQVDEEIIQERYALVMELQRSISRELCEKRIGEKAKVLVDADLDDPEVQAGIEPFDEFELTPQYVARSRKEAYEVDGLIYAVGELSVGEICDVEIIGSTDHDLLATKA